MSDSETHAFITSSLGCEVGYTALARCLIPEKMVVCANIKMADIVAPETLVNTLVRLSPDKISSVTLLGDFWDSESFDLVKKRYGPIPIYNIKFDPAAARYGKIPDTGDERRPKLPSEFIRERAEAITGTKCILENAVDTRALALIDDRCLSVHVEQTQEFFTGVCNIDRSDSGDAPDGPASSLEGTLYRVLHRDIALGEVLAVGRKLVACQKGMVQERVRANSRAGAFANGVTFAVADASELVNLTHDALHKAYPAAQVTIVVSLKLIGGGAKKDAISHSFRSWDPSVDVKKLVGKYGGGSSSAAGGRRDIDICLDYGAEDAL